MEFPANNLLLHVQELKTYFYTFEGIARAVDDVSFYPRCSYRMRRCDRTERVLEEIWGHHYVPCYLY